MKDNLQPSNKSARERVDTAAEEAIPLSTEQWKETTASFSNTDKMMIKIFREKDFEFRRSKAYSLLEEIGGEEGEFAALFSLLPDEVLDRVIESFKSTES